MFQVVPQALKPNTYYIFNHLEFTITYHSGKHEDWGSSFSSEGGRIIGVSTIILRLFYTYFTNSFMKIVLKYFFAQL